MKLKIEVNSVAYGAEYGGQQIIEAKEGEYRLDEVFRLPFFRIVIDDVIGDALCFRLMEGAIAHYFVLETVGEQVCFSRETSIGGDDFIFTLLGGV